MIICSCLVVVANFTEAERVHLSSKIWLGAFIGVSVLLPVLGIIDFRGYDKAKVRRSPARTRSCRTVKVGFIGPRCNLLVVCALCSRIALACESARRAGPLRRTL